MCECERVAACFAASGEAVRDASENVGPMLLALGKLYPQVCVY